MTASQKATNPFYVLLVLAGLLFFVTATAYGVMTVRQLQVRDQPDESATSRQFLQFMDRYGSGLLMSELAVLGLATVAAMGTDRYWIRRAARGADMARKNEEPPSPVKQG